MFPENLCHKMIDIVRKKIADHEPLPSIDEKILLFKLEQAEYMSTTREDIANRMLGYYQRVGEELNYWTLDEISK